MQLQIYATSTLNAGFFVNSVADDSWAENTISGTTAPQIGPPLGPARPVPAVGYVTVTLPPSTVSGNGDVNLALTPNSATALAFASREDPAGNGPKLIVTTS